MEQTDKKEMRSTVRDQAQGIFKQWNDRATIKKGDSLGKIVKRILIRIGGILVMIVFSPFLLLALLIAFVIAL